MFTTLKKTPKPKQNKGIRRNPPLRLKYILFIHRVTVIKGCESYGQSNTLLRLKTLIHFSLRCCSTSVEGQISLNKQQLLLVHSVFKVDFSFKEHENGKRFRN